MLLYTITCMLCYAVVLICMYGIGMWIVIQLCTMWAFLREGNGEVLMLDWQRVTVNKEYWRLLTTFTTLGNRKDLSLNVFSLFKLYFQKHYEPDIGTKK